MEKKRVAQTKKRRSMKSFSRLMKIKTARKISQGKDLINALRQVSELKSEVALLTSYSTDVIYRLRYDSMKYDYISPSITKLLGYSMREMRRINIRNLIVETRIISDGMKPVEDFVRLETFRKSGEVNKWQADYLIKTKDGRRIWVSDISYPWFDEKGAIIGSVGSLRDISDRIEAENQVKEELKRIANTDPLTSLANRRVFFEKLDDELKRIRRGRGEFSVLLLDLDHFKKINDSYGHDVGDYVLVETTRILRDSLREVDVPARLGGEEFGIFLPDTGADGAFLVAERLRQSIAKHVYIIDQKQQTPIGCTVSIGVATARFDDDTDSTRLYKTADTRLYIAKNAGRNQVCSPVASKKTIPILTQMH